MAQLILINFLNNIPRRVNDEYYQRYSVFVAYYFIQKSSGNKYEKTCLWLACQYVGNNINKLVETRM